MSKNILLFPGQGSHTNFARDCSSKVMNLLSTHPVATSFLRGCHAVFIAELYTLDSRQIGLLGERPHTAFDDPNSLVNPSACFQTNPIIQGISLYVNQLLEFILYSEGSGRELSDIVETSGFCSGILSAIITATVSLPGSAKFLRYAVNGFRLSFWIGIRSAIFSRDISETSTIDNSWSLALLGLTEAEVEKLLTVYNSSRAGMPLRISAVVAEKVISLSGEGSALEDFKSNHVPDSATARFTNVHAYYHGGPVLLETLDKVMADAERIKLEFPTWETLQIPVRSSIDGEYLAPTQQGLSLLETALQSMLIHRVNWKLTSESLLLSLQTDSTAAIIPAFRVVVLGPNARSLVMGMKHRKEIEIDIPDILSSHSDDASPHDIAIVGMSVNFPAGDGQEEMWATLSKGLNVAQEIPASRFSLSDYHGSHGTNETGSRSMDTKYGNFVDNPFMFDNSFFRISAREAKSMDPQQRLLLHAALEALDDAGYAPNSSPTFQTEDMGVYVGVATGDYVANSRDDIDVYYSPGTLRAFLSGRISYAFRFMGPSVVIDTACSSSMVAIYQACRALQAFDCSSALAGGVNVISSPDMYLGLSRAHFLSSTGQCKPFDTFADGYCRSEGCGMFVLKRLSDAVAEGDRIYGVIRGIEVNQCGTAKSITHPDSETQAKLFKSLLSKSCVSADSISVIEAHGTGTKAGDYAEITSIQSAFGLSRKSNNPLIVSSIKGNIGHAEAASGAASLAKLLLMMQKKQIPPQASFKTLNPRLASMIEHSITVPTVLKQWDVPKESPRRAVLNNFGAAGSNAALILEEYKIPSHDLQVPERSCHILNISAKTADALKQLREEYCTLLESRDKRSSPVNLCFSANARRQQYDDYRISVMGKSAEDLLKKLQQVDIPTRFLSKSNSPTVFVFSGQGSVFKGMGAELLATAPVFKEAVNACDVILSSNGFTGVDFFFRDPQFLDARDKDWQNTMSQCACFVLEYALAQLWISWGVIPDMLVGHSLGEYPALVIAGVLSLSDALWVVSNRAELMTTLCARNTSGMLACNISPSRVETILSHDKASFHEITVACKNSDTDCVVAGPLKVLQHFKDFCTALGCKTKNLDVPFGFHSSAMDIILEPMANIVSSIRTNEPRLPIVSSVSGALLEENDIQPDYFINHARKPVEFLSALQTIAGVLEQKAITFLEVGSRPITLPLVRATWHGTNATFLSSMSSVGTPWTNLFTSLRTMYLERYPIQWKNVYDGTEARFFEDIPGYPLAPSEFIFPFKEPAGGVSTTGRQDPAATKSPYTFLDPRYRSSHNGITMFDTSISTTAKFIESHSVGGAFLCPASVYAELALEAVKLEIPELQVDSVVLNDISFEKPLVYIPGRDCTIQISLNLAESSFHILSNAENMHCKGSYTITINTDVEKAFARNTAYIKRQRRSVSLVDQFSARMIYEVVFPRVVAYSGPYLTVKHLSIASSGLEAFGTFELPSTGGGNFVCPPAFTDTLLHAAGFVANSKIRADEACICVKVETVKLLLIDPALFKQEMQVYCSLVEYSNEYIIADAYAFNSSDKVVASVQGMHFKKLHLKSFQAHLARTNEISDRTSQRGRRQGSNTSCLQAPAKASTKSDGKLNDTFVPARLRRNIMGANPQEEIRSKLRQTLIDVCGADETIDFSTSLAEMGVDSLLSIELAHEVQQQFPTLNLSRNDLQHCSSLEAVEALVTRAIDTARPLNQDSESSTSNSSTSTYVPTVTPAEEDSVGLHAVLEQVCGFNMADIDKDCTLESIGVDSLLSIELERGFRETLGLDLKDVHANVSVLSIRQLERRVHEKLATSAAKERPVTSRGSSMGDTMPPSDVELSSVQNDATVVIAGKENFLTEVQSSGHTNAALYLFHDGSGICNVYSRLGSLNRTVYSVSSLDLLEPDPDARTVEQLATAYITNAGFLEKRIENIILGGWSFGGVVAFEVSRQLQAAGRSAKGVILIDSPAPVNHEPLPNAIISEICAKMASPTPARNRLRVCIEAQFKLNAASLSDYKPQPTPTTIPCIMLKCIEVLDTVKLYGVSYPWLSDKNSRQESIRLWEVLVGRPITTIDVRGNHFDLFSAGNVDKITEKLTKACQMLDNDLV